MDTPRRGRPPKLEGPKTPAERKREQRARDRAHLTALGASLDEATTSALIERLHYLCDGEHPGTLGAVLTEIGRRGAVVVRARLSGTVGKRVKS